MTEKDTGNTMSNQTQMPVCKNKFQVFKDWMEGADLTVGNHREVSSEFKSGAHDS